jgi:hypothetical protein
MYAFAVAALHIGQCPASASTAHEDRILLVRRQIGRESVRRDAGARAAAILRVKSSTLDEMQKQKTDTLLRCRLLSETVERAAITASRSR